MNRTLCMAVAGVLLSSTLYAGPAGNSNDKEKKAKYEPVSNTTSASVRIAFQPREVRIIREYYGPRYRSLPPGLQKKYHRTGQLPPGWQKKMQPFPVAVVRQMTGLPGGYSRGVIDGHAIIYNSRTQTIVDLAVLF